MCNETVHKCHSSSECCTKVSYYDFDDELQEEYSCLSPALELAYQGLTDLLEDIEDYRIECLEEEKILEYQKYKDKVTSGGNILGFSVASVLAILALFT